MSLWKWNLETHQLEELGAEDITAPSPIRRSEAEIYSNLQATDGTDLSTRKRHRDYMAANDLVMTSDVKGVIAKAEAVRQLHREGKSTPEEKRRRTEHVAQSFYELRERKRR